MHVQPEVSALSPRMDFKKHASSKSSSPSCVLFDAISNESREACIAGMKICTFDKGEVIVEQGSVGTTMVRDMICLDGI